VHDSEKVVLPGSENETRDFILTFSQIEGCLDRQWEKSDKTIFLKENFQRFKFLSDAPREGERRCPSCIIN
jgi:hypothetical protein